MTGAPDRKTVLMFGGKTADRKESDELWEWNGERWRLVPRGVPHPPARIGPGLAFDTRRDVLVVYGGALSDGRHLGDLWEWDGSTWRQAAGDPGPRVPGGLVFDGRRTVLFGGSTPRDRAYEPRDDTWSWDGEIWRELAPPKRPTPRNRSAMAWDPARRVVVLFGGVREGQPLQDTWELRPVPR